MSTTQPVAKPETHPASPPKMQRCQVWLPLETIAAVDAIAAETGLAQSSVLRMLVLRQLRVSETL